MAINGLLLMLGVTLIAKFDVIFVIAGIIVALNYLYNHVNGLDIFICFFMIILVLSSSLMDYPFELWYYGVRYQILTMIFFFIGKDKRCSDLLILDNGTKVVTIVGVLGILLLIFSPSWYVSWKISVFDEISETRFMEMMRLSAFWKYPYWISYGSCLVFLYTIYKTFARNNWSLKIVILLMFLLAIQMLAQQRAPLLFSLLFFFIISIRLVFSRKDIYKKAKKYLLGIVVLFTVVIVLLILEMDDNFMMFFMDKMDEMSNSTSDSSFLERRSEIYKDFFNKSITLFGDGIGIYSHRAFELGRDAITDQQYLKILYESGLFGLFGYGIIIGASLYKGVRRFKQNVLELAIIIFYCIAMFGANCISVFDEHCVVFWLCCGRVFRNKNKIKFNQVCLSIKS